MNDEPETEPGARTRGLLLLALAGLVLLIPVVVGIIATR